MSVPATSHLPMLSSSYLLQKKFKVEEPVQVLENVVFFHKFTMYSVIEIDFDIFDVSRTFTIMVGYVFLIRYTFSENKSDPVP